MKIIDIQQGTQEWHDRRRCMVTGSKMDSVTGTPLDRLMLVCDLIAEKATEQSKILKATPEMERGNAEEVFARKHYEQITGKKVTQIGFCVSDEFDYLGVSGDGWLEDKSGKLTGAIEIKSPDTKNAVFYKLADKIPAEELGLGSWSKPTKVKPEPEFTPSAKAPFLGVPAIYKWQIVTYFMVNTDLEYLDFLVYDARFINDDGKMHTVTIRRDNLLLQEALKEAREKLISFREFWLKCEETILPDNF